MAQHTAGHARLARLFALALSALPLGTLSGCFTEGGPMMSLDRFTYVSTPSQPKTISLVDTRTFESIWSMDIPVGQQLALEFHKDKRVKEGEIADPWRPDLMKWGLMPAGQMFGQLHNQISVPASHSRRIEMKLRQSPEMPDKDAQPFYQQPSDQQPYMSDKVDQPTGAAPATVHPVGSEPTKAPEPAAPTPTPEKMPESKPAPAPAPEAPKPADPPVDLPK